jgi:CheY-like chemotaxis protein
MERRTAFRPQRVLLVDDSRDIRELWRQWLTFWGFAVEEAQNGAEAVQKARTHPPDLILLDLAMPVLDGREAMRLLAADRTTARVPVLAMSAQLSGEGAPETGTEPFLPKPVDSDQLLGHIRAALRPRRSSSAVEA